jgi:AcrR family transcriptional regulator
MTVNELSARAGISKRTLYRYFDSKEAVIEATIEHFMQEMLETINHLAGDEQTPEIILQTVLKQLIARGQFLVNPVTLDDLRTHYPQMWAKIDSFRMERIQTITRHWLNHSSHGITGSIDPNIITVAIMACIQAVLNPEFIIGNGLTFESAAKQLSSFLSAALK